MPQYQDVGQFRRDIKNLRRDANRLETQMLKFTGWVHATGVDQSLGYWQKTGPDGRIMVMPRAEALVIIKRKPFKEPAKVIDIVKG